MDTPLRIKGILAKVETEYGVDAVPTALLDGVQVEENFWNEIDISFAEENLRDELAHAGLGRAGLAQPTGEIANLSLAVALKGVTGALAAENLPEWDPLHMACGHGRTIDDTAESETVTYGLLNTGHSSATIYAYAGGLLFKIVGVRGNVTEEWNPGGFVMARYSLQGVVAEVSQAALPTIIYAQKDVIPPTVKNAGMEINEVAPDDFSEWELDFQLEVAFRPRGNAEVGHAGFGISDYNPQISAVIDRPALASLDPYALRRNGTLFPWQIGPVGATQYNQLSRSGPAGRVVSTPHSDADGLAMVGVVFRAQHSDEEVGDDAIELVVS